IGYIRPSLTEHVRSTAMDRHIGYIRPSLTEHVCSTVRWTHSTKLDGTFALDCGLHIMSFALG
ncbi:hypothetical protein AeMF1_008352, partial [Aphanomyces euteiches]